jgi:FKBP-type peptidyl-prolyl cis-trans isomerase SlyD
MSGIPVNVREKCAVEIHYKLTLEGGRVVDSSEGQEPLKYLHGVGMLVPGLERELEGKAAGDQFQVTIQPEDGYGHPDPDLIQRVGREILAGIDELEVGMQLEAQGPEGHTHLVIVQEIEGDEVTLNANPPLAGEVLHFDIEVATVREATEQELEHGHVHAP